MTNPFVRQYTTDTCGYEDRHHEHYHRLILEREKFLYQHHSIIYPFHLTLCFNNTFI